MQLPLNQTKESGIKYNIDKYLFGQTKTEYLGLWITHNGLEIINKKIEPINNMIPPNLRKGVRKFIALVNYYLNMWSKRLHTLAPLTMLASSKVEFTWTEVKKKAFEPQHFIGLSGFNKEFKIYTNASDFQLGEFISQEGKPITFHSIKLTKPLTRYTEVEN